MARPSQGIRDGVRIKVYIPRDVDAAINSLVAMSGGVSKATFLRQALFAGLEPYSLLTLAPEVAAALAVTKQPSQPNREKE